MHQRNEDGWADAHMDVQIPSVNVFYWTSTPPVASERMSAAERASKASSAEQTNLWAVRVNERADEQMANKVKNYVKKNLVQF